MGAEKKGSTTVTVADPASSDKSISQEVVKFNAEALIAQAIEKGTDVNTMERLLAMRRELKAEWAAEQYNMAMAAFQSECPTIKKTKPVKTNTGAIAYHYAPLESIVEQVKVPLQKNGFSYSTSMEVLEAGVKVTVKVTHKDGHSEITPMEVPLGNKTNIMSESQVTAAASTFAKRYAFCNAFGILTGDEDTDAAPQKPQNAPKPNANPSTTATVAQAPKQATLPNHGPAAPIRTVVAIINSMEIAAAAKDIGKLERLRQEFIANATHYSPADNGFMRNAILRIQKEMKGE